MKIKNILAALFAVLAISVACTEEGDHYLSEVKLSSSYVAIDMNGGTTSITVDATSSWSIASAPEWLTISPVSGSAGSTSVSFSAPTTLDGRTAELVLTCDNKTQRINVIQGLAVVSPATCAEIIAGPDSKSYRVTGVCTRIANTQYGNWYINDGTGEVYIYGTVNASGSYAWSSFNIEVGDEVTVEGPKTTYNGTVELVDATFISVSKSLIKVEATDPEDAVIPSEGGEITVTLTNKGTGLYVEVPAEAKSWLSIASINGNSVTFRAAENNGGARTVTLTFSTKSGNAEYTAQTEITQEGSVGSLALPFTVSEAIAYLKKLDPGAVTNTELYIKGIVSKVVEGFGAQYGNSTFWISEDGVFNDDKEKDFEAYRVVWLDGKKWAEGNAQIEEGMEVVLCGKLQHYSKDGVSTFETASGAYVYSVNGVTTDAEGIGSLANPFTVAGAIAAANSVGSTNSNFNAYVKGVVCSIVNNGQFGAEYGNGTFWISEDGEYNNDKTQEFEAYRVLWLGNKKWVDGNPLIEVGDEVILYGTITLYNGTAETASGKAYVYSHNGKTE